MKVYYQDDLVTLYHGDCREQRFNKVQLLLTDIPYTISQKHGGLREIHFGEWDEDFDLGTLELVLPKYTESAYVWCAAEQLSEVLKILEQRGMSTRALVWNKPAPSPMNGEYIWLSGMELCAYGKRSKATFNGFCESNVLTFKTEKQKLHPTQKPLSLFHKLIGTSTNKNDLVFDPFTGSGTTLVAAKDLGRRAVGIEREERYCEIAANRLQQGTLGL